MQLPSRTLTTKTKIFLRRILPAPGEILVQPGQSVEALTVVARAEIPSRYRIIDVAGQLGRPQPDMDEIMLVEVGDSVKASQVIASLQGRLPFLQRSVRAPAAGYIATIGPGWVLLETNRTTIELQAFINGRVNRLLSTNGVVLEAQGAIIEAACGFGGEAHGQLKRLVNSPYEELKAEKIDENASHAILLGGRTLNEDTLRTAEKWQVRGIIVGSIDAALLKLDPPTRVRVVATEGFGNLPMSPHTFSVLTSLSRQAVSIRGQTPHLNCDSGTIPPEEAPIILATTTSVNYSYSKARSTAKIPEITTGNQVRVIQGRRIGLIGTVESMPAEPQPTEAGIITPGANVKFNDGIRFIPWANLEFIE